MESLRLVVLLPLCSVQFMMLAGSLQKSSGIYLEKKEKEMEARERSGRSPEKSHYENVRIRCAEEVRRNIEEMRNKMFEERMKEKQRELQAACDEGIQGGAEEICHKLKQKDRA